MTDKSCKGCVYEECDEEDECLGCSRLTDNSSSCHINPPCGVCTSDYYQEKEG